MESNMEDFPPVAPKAKRRSSFFERRTSAIMPVIPDDASNVDLVKQEEELKQKNIELYMEQLNTEKTAWENCYRTNKSAYKESKQRSKNTSHHDAPLLPEHAAFLAQRPDLSKLARDMSSVTNAASSLLMLRRRFEAALLRAVDAQLEREAPVKQDILELSNVALED